MALRTSVAAPFFLVLGLEVAPVKAQMLLPFALERAEERGSDAGRMATSANGIRY